MLRDAIRYGAKVGFLFAVPLVFVLSACGAPAEDLTEYNPEPVPHRLDSVNVDGTAFTKINVKGTDCIVATNPDDYKVVMSCNWISGQEVAP